MVTAEISEVMFDRNGLLNLLIILTRVAFKNKNFERKKVAFFPAINIGFNHVDSSVYLLL
jgi:hypothetical protein